MQKTRIEKIKRNTATSIVSKGVFIVLQFLSRIIFVQYLRAEYLGIDGLFYNVINFLSLADLGLTTAMTYSLYGAIAEENRDHINALIQYFKKIFLLIAVAIGTIGIMIIPFLKYIINLENTIDNIYAYYLLFLMKTVITYLFIYRTTLITADQKKYVIDIYEIMIQIVTFLVKNIILVICRNYFLYLLSEVICRFIGNVVCNRVAYRLYPFLKEKAGDLEEQERKNIFENVKSLFIFRISGILQTNTDSILISFFVGTIIVGYYSNYTMIIMALGTVIDVIFNAAKASFGNYIAQNGAKSAKELFDVLDLISFWMTLFCTIGFIVCSNSFIQTFFGEKYVLNKYIVVLISLMFYTNNVRQSIWLYRETTGIFSRVKYITTVTALLNVVLSIILGRLYGLEGILSASILARILYASWREPYVIYKEQFNCSPREYYRNYVVRLSVGVVITIVTLSICDRFVGQNSIEEFLVRVLICCVVPNVLLLLIFGRTKECKYIWNKVFYDKA